MTGTLYQYVVVKNPKKTETEEGFISRVLGFGFVVGLNEASAAAHIPSRAFGDSSIDSPGVEVILVPFSKR